VGEHHRQSEPDEDGVDDEVVAALPIRDAGDGPGHPAERQPEVAQHQGYAVEAPQSGGADHAAGDVVPRQPAGGGQAAHADGAGAGVRVDERDGRRRDEPAGESDEDRGGSGAEGELGHAGALGSDGDHQEGREQRQQRRHLDAEPQRGGDGGQDDPGHLGGDRAGGGAPPQRPEHGGEQPRALGEQELAGHPTGGDGEGSGPQQGGREVAPRGAQRLGAFHGDQGAEETEHHHHAVGVRGRGGGHGRPHAQAEQSGVQAGEQRHAAQDQQRHPSRRAPGRARGRRESGHGLIITTVIL